MAPPPRAPEPAGQPPGGWAPARNRVSQADIKATCTAGWRIESIEPATIEITSSPDGLRAWLAAPTRTCPGQDQEGKHMLTAEAVIKTERPDRYLAQLGKHASQIGGHGGRTGWHLPDGHGDSSPEIQHAEWSGTYGTVTLNRGRWTMQAAPGTLTIRAEAADEEHLQAIQEMLTRRLESFGRREHLTVQWQRPGTPTAIPGQAG